MSRLTFSDEMISQMRTNMTAALGRIVDVDIAEESTELAKNQVLVQASAAMLAQANSTTDIALMLLVKFQYHYTNTFHYIKLY